MLTLPAMRLQSLPRSLSPSALLKALRPLHPCLCQSVNRKAPRSLPLPPLRPPWHSPSASLRALMSPHRHPLPPPLPWPYQSASRNRSVPRSPHQLPLHPRFHNRSASLRVHPLPLHPLRLPHLWLSPLAPRSRPVLPLSRQPRFPASGSLRDRAPSPRELQVEL